MDILAPITMKNAAKCDMQCELQNSSSIRFLNASRAGLISSMFVSVYLKSNIIRRLNLMILSLNMKALNSAGQWSSHLTLSDLVESNEFIKVLLINFSTTPEIRQDYPLNLSISVSGGKENNNDSPSSGEWTGKSSKWKSAALSCRIVIGIRKPSGVM